MQEPQEIEPAPRHVVGRVLATHPEGPSMFSEAGHRHSLAEHSAAQVSRAFTAMQTARLGYEELRHRLDPRHTKPVHFGVAMLLLTVIFTALTLLDAIEFTGVLTGWMRSAAVAAAAAWTGCAWLAALGVRERRHRLLALVTAVVVTAGLLLAALHSDGTVPGQAHRWYRLGVGTAVALLVFALVAVAAVLITRTEPASLLFARRRWHRFRAEYAAAVELQRTDAEADAVAGEGWRSLIRAQAHDPAGGGEPPPEGN